MDITGTKWTSRDGKRTVTVQSEAASWRGERMFLVKGAESGRERLISYIGLLRKYRRHDDLGA